MWIHTIISVVQFFPWKRFHLLSHTGVKVVCGSKPMKVCGSCIRALMFVSRCHREQFDCWRMAVEDVTVTLSALISHLSANGWQKSWWVWSGMGMSGSWHVACNRHLLKKKKKIHIWSSADKSSRLEVCGVHTWRIVGYKCICESFFFLMTQTKY